MASNALTIALAGNPNVGKSTLFNALTGSRQHVGNWPGKTVERKEGRLRIDDQDVVVVDLPGIYSLTSYSIEEVISRDFIVNQRPDVVVGVVDAANLERNLYLVTQILETESPLIIALNMLDVARGRGVTIDTVRLSQRLNGATVIETVGSSGVGIDRLKAALRQVATTPPQQPVRIPYHPALEKEITALEQAIAQVPALTQTYRARWLAIKLLEADETLIQRLESSGYVALLAQAREAAQRVASATGEDAETLIVDGRYEFIRDVVKDTLARQRHTLETRSDRIDRVLTHRLYGLPIFLFLMWVVFQLTANVSAPFLDWIDGVITGPIARWVSALLDVVGLGGSWAEALLVDGVLAGVGGVLVFVPVLMTLYIALGILEDSGYMARAAFVMDRFMRRLGLHGKSFLPMLVGFGCTVPAVYATRTLETEEDRKFIAFLVSFMSCGARLPVYVVIGAAFFGQNSGALIFAMYLLGIAVALVTGFVLRRTVYRHKPLQPFVMELPPYHIPSLRNVWRQTWTRTSSFIHGAGTTILAASMVIWLLTAIPINANGRFNDVAPKDSVFGAVSHALAPLFAPLGFGSWQASGALISGFVAKEVVVGTMSVIIVGEAEEEAPSDAPVSTFIEDLGEIGTSFIDASVLTVQELVNIIPRTVNIIPVVHMPEADFLGASAEEEDTTALEAGLRDVFTPLAAVAFTVFVLLYTPCMSTVAAMRHEFGTRFMAYQIAYTLVVAWLASVIVYQGGLLLGLGG